MPEVAASPRDRGTPRASALRQLLGLDVSPRNPDGWTIDRAEAIGGDCVRICLKNEALRFAIRLRPRDFPKAYSRTSMMSLMYEGATLEPAMARLLETVQRGLDGASLADVRALLPAPPRRAPAQVACGKERGCLLSGRENALGAAVADSLSVKWEKDPESWRRFIVPDLDYFFTCMISPTAIILHHDLECRTIFHAGAHQVSLYNEPIARCEDRDWSGNVMLYTDLRDSDLLQGPNARLTRLLEDLRKQSPRPPRLVVILGGCLEEVVGEDANLAIRRAGHPERSPIISIGVSGNGARGILYRLLKARKDAIGGTRGGGRKAPNSVDFLGFAQTRSFMRLARVLKELGIKTNAALVPFFDEASIGRFGRGGVRITMKGSSRLKTKEFRSICPEAPGLERALSAPYGVKATRAWLKNIARIFGKDEAFAAAWRRYFEPYATEWTALRRECRRRALGFVVDDDSLSRLQSSSGFNGVPILQMVSEMGFQVSLFRYSRGGPRPPKAPGDPRCFWFSSRAELDRLLHREPLDAIYSDVCFDRRVLRAGRAQFSLRESDMGVDGALRLGHAVLSACRTSFFRKHRNYLGAG
ncbi:MAG: nitrogenase component 1 [Elusimicrobiota bacterium]